MKAKKFNSRQRNQIKYYNFQKVGRKPEARGAIYSKKYHLQMLKYYDERALCKEHLRISWVKCYKFKG